MSGDAPELTGPTCFCRDCLGDLDFTAQSLQRMRLAAAGPPPRVAFPHPRAYRLRRVLRHGRKARQSRIADKPVIIGGGKRGVVSAACYIARTFGVRSAMPMFKALALCPSAMVIRPDMAKYVRVGREVRHAMQALTPLVEPLSIDEAFLDLSGTSASTA